MPNIHVAIIGAGLSGLALALALHKQGIACTLFEARDAPLNTGGGLNLTPNGLKVLRAIGIYDSLVDQAFAFDNVYVQDGPTGAILESVEYGNAKKYGMRALRAHRFTVLKLLLAEVRAKGILIHFNRRYSRIISETDEQVTWEFTDGSRSSASVLVGADGIHSTVRNYLVPDSDPIYEGVVALVAAVRTAQLGLPARDRGNLNNVANRHPLPSGISVPGFGAFVSAPQTKNGDELMITVMRYHPDEPERWGPINDDKERLRGMFRQNADKFPEVVRNAVADIPGEQLHIWPSYRVPPLERWASTTFKGEGKGRVVILGDAAHALPPSAGQGVNQAFEDIHLFAGVLGGLGDSVTSERLQIALHNWQQYRERRLAGVRRLTKQMEIRRLPAAAQGGHDPESVKASMSGEFDKLFKIDLKEAIDECLNGYPPEA